MSQGKPTTQKAPSEPDRALLDELNSQAAGNGPAVLLIHAGITDARMWEPQWPSFTQAFRVIRADLRGFGKSARRTVDGADHHDLARLLDWLGIERVALVGSSFGGNVAVDFALTYPERTSALVLSGTLAGMTDPSPRLREIWNETDAAQTGGEIERGVELELRAWVDGPVRAPDEVDAEVRAAVRTMNRSIWERAIAEPPPETSEPPVDRVERLSEIAVPVLLVEGTLDQPDVAASMDRLAQGIPRAERICIPGTAHFPNLERPAAFNEAVLEFLPRVSPTR